MYFFFLTSTRFGIDKQVGEQNDLERLPIMQNVGKSEMDAVVSAFESHSAGLEKDFLNLDNAIFDSFELPEWERDYVTSVVENDLDFLRHGAKAAATAKPTANCLRSYAETICGEVRATIGRSTKFKITADVIDGLQDISVVVIRFDENRNRKPKLIPRGKFEFDGRLANLLHAPLSTSFRLRRSLVMFDDNRCIIVKLAQKRFWSKARAFDDADTILAELTRQ